MVELQVSIAGARWERGETNGGQNFVPLKRGREQVHKEFSRGYPTLASGAYGLDFGVEREDGRRPVACRIGMGETAAHGPFVSHLGVANFSRRFGQERALGFEQVRRLDAEVRGGRANLNLVAVLADIREIRDAADVNQVFGRSQAQLHQWNQAVPSRQYLPIGAKLRHQAHGFGKGLGRVISERFSNHRSTSVL